MGERIFESSKLKQIDNITDAQIQRIVKEKTNRRVKEYLSKITSQIPKLLTPITGEVFGYYKIIVNTTFTEVFTRTYGKNFNQKSLLNSISCTLDNNLSPIISYDMDTIELDSSLYKDSRRFNLNIDHTDFNSLLEDDEFMSLEQEDYDEYDNPFMISLDESNNEIDLSNSVIFSSYNKTKRTGGYSNLLETYIKAKNLAIQRYMIEFEKTIRPKISEKYGILI